MRKKLLLFLSIYLLISAGLHALDKATIMAEIRRLSLDVAEERWADSVLETRMEIVHIGIARKSKCLQGTTTYIVYQSTKEYTLPTDCLFVERVSFQIGSSTGAYEKIPRWTLLDLDVDGSQWQRKPVGLPKKYYIWSNKLGLVPPASATYDGAAKLQIHYIINPSSMTADSSVPFNGQTHLYPYHELIIWRVVMMNKLDERAYAEANDYENKYDRGLAIMTKEVGTRGDDFPTPSEMGY